MSAAQAPLRLRFGDVESHAEGRVLVGGNAGRVLRLTATGADLVRRWRGGGAVGEGRGERALARRLVRSGFAHPTWEAAPFGPSDVTVVVPVLDDVDGLRSLIEALDDRLALVVVDDGSADASSIASAAGRALVVRRDAPGGPAAARNLGRRHVETPITAFIDADCHPAAGWLDHLLAHFADPEVVAVAPRVRSVPGPSVLERYESARSPLDLGPDPAEVTPRTRVSYVPSACLVVRSDVPDFDAELRFGEDVDLIWRLVDAGHSIRYEPSAVAWHRSRSTWHAWWRQRKGYGTAAAPLADRHAEAAVPLAIDGRSAGVWALTLFGRPGLATMLALGSGGGVVHRLRELGIPTRRAAALAGRGQLSVGGYAASAVTRTWWPIALSLGIGRRRSRVPLAAAVLVPSVVEWWRARPPVDPVRYVALRVADDLAYGVGLWSGCRTERSLRALRPSLASSGR